MNESKVSTKIREAIQAHGAVCWKMSDRFHASRPDLMAWRDGCTVVIETKVHPNKPTPLQLKTLEELRAAGCDVYVATYYSNGAIEFHGLSKVLFAVINYSNKDIKDFIPCLFGQASSHIKPLV